MKHTKKLLALLLAALLALGLSAPAMAEVNWDDFYFISQPPAKLTIPFGEDFTLSVEVNVPAEVEVTYDWHSPRWGRTGKAQGAVFHCTPDHPYYPKAPASRPYLEQTVEYICVIYGLEKDAGGNVVGYTQYLEMQHITVTVLPEREPTRWETIRDFLLMPVLFVIGFFAAAPYSFAILFAVLLYPFAWLFE